MNFSTFPLIIAGVLLNTAAQLLLKAGANRLNQFQFVWEKLSSLPVALLQNPPILIGLLLYVFSVAIWLLVLTKIEVSVAYPLVSLGYIINAIMAYYFFGESLSLMRFAGILVILIGVFLVARS